MRQLVTSCQQSSCIMGPVHGHCVSHRRVQPSSRNSLSARTSPFRALKDPLRHAPNLFLPSTIHHPGASSSLAPHATCAAMVTGTRLQMTCAPGVGVGSRWARGSISYDLFGAEGAWIGCRCVCSLIVKRLRNRIPCTLGSRNIEFLHE